MNKNILLNGLIISFLFLVAKFIEMRFITKENLPPKILVRDAILVYAAVIASHYIMTQLNNMNVRWDNGRWKTIINLNKSLKPKNTPLLE